jgi:hypothetical protein
MPHFNGIEVHENNCFLILLFISNIHYTFRCNRHLQVYKLVLQVRSRNTAATAVGSFYFVAVLQPHMSSVVQFCWSYYFSSSCVCPFYKCPSAVSDVSFLMVEHAPTNHVAEHTGLLLLHV